MAHRTTQTSTMGTPSVKPRGGSSQTVRKMVAAAMMVDHVTGRPLGHRNYFRRLDRGQQRLLLLLLHLLSLSFQVGFPGLSLGRLLHQSGFLFLEFQLALGQTGGLIVQIVRDDHGGHYQDFSIQRRRPT